MKFKNLNEDIEKEVSRDGFMDAWWDIEEDNQFDRIKFYRLDSGRRADSTTSMGLNMSATGTISADEAIKFAEDILKAAKAAKSFKYNGYKIKY